MSTLQNTRALTDKLAISLSMLCVAHCLLLPLILVFLPSLLALNLENEAFHLWMVIFVLPTSLYALTMGCKEHKQYKFFILGILGLALLVTPFALGEERITENMEKLLTLAGSSLIALSHFINYRLCRQLQDDRKNQDDCKCHDKEIA